MHIPDGFLDAKTVVATTLLSTGGLALALQRVQRSLPRQRVPLLGLAAAFVFVAQMINFPVASGTSGHLIGASLCAVLLGPSAAVVVMASVLMVQCFLCADGGVLALGANVFNMAIVSVLCGHLVHRLLRCGFRGTRGLLLSAGFAAWCATVLAALLLSGELAWSGTVPWQLALPAMVGVHMLIGAGEAAITMLTLAALARTRPELLLAAARAAPPSPRRYGKLAGCGVLVVLGLALLAAPHASSLPDGLHHVARALGFDHRSAAAPVPAPLRDYQLQGMPSSPWATAWAAVIGMVAAFVFAYALARLLLLRSDRCAPSSPR